MGEKRNWTSETSITSSTKEQTDSGGRGPAGQNPQSREGFGKKLRHEGPEGRTGCGDNMQKK